MNSSTIRMGSAFALALVFVLFLAPSAGHGQVPRTINYQGVLTDNAGAPVTGSVTMTFRLYNAMGATTALWAEVQTVMVINGTFSVVLGNDAGNPLQDSFFEGPLFLGTAAGGDAEMTPRQALTSAPQAIRAKTAENVFPAGAIMLFDLAACPTGWSELVNARGRALVGLPGGGALGGALGTALTNLENRNHQHDVNPVSTFSTTVANHVHDVSGTITVTDVGGAHFHSANPPATTSTSDEHHHEWSRFTNTEAWQTFVVNGSLITLHDWGDGMDSAGSGEFPLNLSTTSTSTRFFYTSNDSHSHSTDIAQFFSGSAGDHSHQFTVPASTASSSGGHNHLVNVANTTSTSAGTANVMPYIQFLVCRKD